MMYYQRSKKIADANLILNLSKYFSTPWTYCARYSAGMLMKINSFVVIVESKNSNRFRRSFVFKIKFLNPKSQNTKHTRKKFTLLTFYESFNIVN